VVPALIELLKASADQGPIHIQHGRP
jgi:hypothetical protein